MYTFLFREIEKLVLLNYSDSDADTRDCIRSETCSTNEDEQTTKKK